MENRNTIRVGVEQVVSHFDELEDPRSKVNLRHPLESMLVIAIMARPPNGRCPAGAGGPTAIAKWTAIKEELLLRLLPLPHGILKKDVYRQVPRTLKPDAFQACFINWLESLRALAADGRSASDWREVQGRKRSGLAATAAG